MLFWTENFGHWCHWWSWLMLICKKLHPLGFALSFSVFFSFSWKIQVSLRVLKKNLENNLIKNWAKYAMFARKHCLSVHFWILFFISIFCVNKDWKLIIGNSNKYRFHCFSDKKSREVKSIICCSSLLFPSSIFHHFAKNEAHQ